MPTRNFTTQPFSLSNKEKAKKSNFSFQMTHKNLTKPIKIGEKCRRKNNVFKIHNLDTNADKSKQTSDVQVYAA